MKDWENISDDEFDEIFRANSQNQEDLWPEAWPLMEEKLDEENRKRRFIIFWRWAAAVLIFGTLGILSIGYFRSNNTENQATSIKDVPEKKSQKNDILKTNRVADNPNKTSQIQNKKEANYRTTPPLELAKNKPIAQKTTITTTARTKEEIRQQEIKEINNTNKELTQIVKSDHLSSTKESDLNKKTENATESQKPVLDEPLISQNKIDAEPKTNDDFLSKDTVMIEAKEANPVLSQNESSNLSEATFQKSSKFFKNLAFNLGVSPDYSKVVSSEFGPLGYNLQILVDYNITKKLTFRGGLIKSLKLYDAYPENYVWPAKWGKPSSPLKEITASCNMLDIPVSLSYNLKEKGSNKFFTTLGITNYKMLKEKYEYTYENNYDPNLKWKKWEGNTGFFGAGVVNFSFGIERRLTQFLSIQVEPFLKIPVKKVGFGDVKLLTTGMFFNLKTHLPSKAQQPK